MPFTAVKIVDPASDAEIGFGIVHTEAKNRLESIVFYKPSEMDELLDRITELNETEAITPFWPDANDGEVQELVATPEFCPEYSILSREPMDQLRRHQAACRVIAIDRSGINNEKQDNA